MATYITKSGIHGTLVRRRGRCLTLLLSGILASVGSVAALAADPSSATSQPESTATLEAIVVTAQKRAQNVQDVPIAIAAITGNSLSDRHIVDMSGLAEAMPNMNFSTDNGSDHITIRGISFNNISNTDAEPRVAYHVDGIYVARPGDISGTFYDIDRVEVLYGPQGTLFGRNAVAGVVNVITRDPTDTLQGYLQTDLGNYSAVNVQGGVGGPLTDTLSARVAFDMTDHEGYGKNLLYREDIDNQHLHSVRAKLKFEPSADFKVVFSADISKQNDRTGVMLGGYEYPNYPSLVTQLGGLANEPGNPRNNYFDTLPLTVRTLYGFGINIDWELGNGYKIASLSSYRHSLSTYDVDFDFSSIPLLSPYLAGESASQISQEIRLQKDFDRGHWMVGGYFFQERYRQATQDIFNTIDVGGEYFISQGIYYGGREKTNAVAAFAQGSYDITDALSLTLGGRYSSDKKSLYEAYNEYDFTEPAKPIYCPGPCTGPTPGFPYMPNDDHRWNNFSPLVTLQYKLDSSKMVYATFSKGFKSGGYQVGETGPVYNPETITDYEVGFKGDFLGNRLQVNGAGFYYDYKNLQVVKVLAAEPVAIVLNAATAKLYGAELQVIAAPAEGLKLDFTVSAMKTEFTNFVSEDPARPELGDLNLAGNRLPGAPSYTGTLGGQYTITSAVGDFTPRAEAETTSQVYLDQYNAAGASVPGYTRWNAFVNYVSSDGRYYGSLYVRNLGNLTRISGGIVGEGFVGLPLESGFIPPRTYGIRFGVKIGKTN